MYGIMLVVVRVWYSVRFEVFMIPGRAAWHGADIGEEKRGDERQRVVEWSGKFEFLYPGAFTSLFSLNDHQ